MKHAAALAVLTLFSVLPSFAQSSQAGQAAEPSEAQTLQAILVELRTMHNDVRLSQTTQILLAELLTQQTAVTRAMQKRDDAKAKLSQLQANERNMTAQIARFDDPSNTTWDAAQRKQMTPMIENFRTSLPAAKAQEQDASNDLQEAEAVLRKEQDALAGIQDQLDAVVKKLQPAANQ
jgi:cell division protein FtsB